MIGGAEYIRSNTGRPDAQLRPEFFLDSVEDEAASAAAGRPIFRDVESVRIIIPGMTASVVVHRVNNSHRVRWADEYDAFRRGMAQPVRGTPIEAWCLMSPAQVKTLRAAEIRTIEELAQISDNAVHKLGMGGMALRQHARAYLDDAAHESLRTELQAERDGLKSAVAALQHQNEEMMRQIAWLGEENRRFAEDAHRQRSYLDGPAGYAVHPHNGYGNGYGNGGAPPPINPAPPPDPFVNLQNVPFSRRAPEAPASSYAAPEERPPAPPYAAPERPYAPPERNYAAPQMPAAPPYAPTAPYAPPPPYAPPDRNYANPAPPPAYRPDYYRPDYRAAPEPPAPEAPYGAPGPVEGEVTPPGWPLRPSPFDNQGAPIQRDPIQRDLARNGTAGSAYPPA